MTKEGLFEKRIDSALKRFYKKFGVNTQLLPKDIIIQVIDEARKEYLVIFDAVQNMDLDTYECEYEGEEITRKDKWFNKWFGEPSDDS